MYMGRFLSSYSAIGDAARCHLGCGSAWFLVFDFDKSHVKVGKHAKYLVVFQNPFTVYQQAYHKTEGNIMVAPLFYNAYYGINSNCYGVCNVW